MVHIRYFQQGNHQIYGVYIRFWPTLVIFLMILFIAGGAPSDRGCDWSGPGRSTAAGGCGWEAA